MTNEEKIVNKSRPVRLEEIKFATDGMFLMIDPFHAVKLSKLLNEQDGYHAFWMIDYVCRDCKFTYLEHPGACENCGSTDICERERDLFPIG